MGGMAKCSQTKIPPGTRGNCFPASTVNGEGHPVEVGDGTFALRDLDNSARSLKGS